MLSRVGLLKNFFLTGAFRTSLAFARKSAVPLQYKCTKAAITTAVEKDSVDPITSAESKISIVELQTVEEEISETLKKLENEKNSKEKSFLQTKWLALISKQAAMISAASAEKSAASAKQAAMILAASAEKAAMISAASAEKSAASAEKIAMISAASAEKIALISASSVKDGLVAESSSKVTRIYNWLKSGVVCEGVLRLEEGAFFPVSQLEDTAGENVVLARSSTLDLLDIFIFVSELKTLRGVRFGGVMITGPPGDGKSFASQYFLWHFVQQGRTVVYENALTRNVWVFRSDGQCRLEVGPAQSTNVPELDEISTIHLFDAKAGADSYQPSASKARIAIFSSTNEKLMKQSLRRNMLHLGFVTSTLEEMKYAKEVLDRPEVDVIECVSKYGGKMRLAFARTPQHADEMIKCAAQMLNIDNIYDVMKNNIEYGVRGGENAPTGLFTTFLDPKLKSELDRYDVEHASSTSRDSRQKDSERMQLLIDLYTALHLVWKINTHTFSIIAGGTKDGVARLADRLISIITSDPKMYQLGGLIGIMLEERAPELLAKGGLFKQRVLSRVRREKLVATEVELKAVELKRLTHEQAPNLEGLLRFSAYHDVLYHVGGVFPALDAMHFPSLAYQITGSTSHTVNLETVSNLNRHLLDHNLPPLVICFVVPEAVFDDWNQEQSYSTSTVSVALTCNKDVLWDGQFQSGVLVNDINTEKKYTSIKCELTHGNLTITTANETTTIEKSQLSKGTLNVTVDGVSCMLKYAEKKADLRFGNLSVEQQVRLAGVTQKVICLPDANDEEMNESLRMLIKANSSAHLKSLVAQQQQEEVTQKALQKALQIEKKASEKAAKKEKKQEGKASEKAKKA